MVSLVRNVTWPAERVLLDAVVLQTASAFDEDLQAVIVTTASAPAGNLSINGTLSNSPTVPTAANLSDAAVIGSNVGVTSTDNISGATFTITGVYLGLSVTDRVTGINNSVVYTNQFFTTVTNVSVDMPVTNFSVGKGGASGSNANASLVLDGTYSNFKTQVPPYVSTFTDMIRTVSVTSDDDLSAIDMTFTIIGTYLGNIVQDQTIASGNLPNASTIQTTQIFDSITQVIISGGTPTNFSIGMGLYGMIQFLNFDYAQSLGGISVQVIPVGNINYSFGATLQNVYDLKKSNTDAYFVATPPVNPPGSFSSNQLFLVDATSTLTNLKTPGFGSSIGAPFKYCTLLITNQSGGETPNTIDENGYLEVYFTLGGI